MGFEIMFDDYLVRKKACLDYKNIDFRGLILVKNCNFPLCYALPIWGCCTNKNEFDSLESIHCRAARVIITSRVTCPLGMLEKQVTGTLYSTLIRSK